MSIGGGIVPPMITFQDTHVGTAGFKGNGEKRQMLDQSELTEEIEIRCSETQTRTTSEGEMQTEREGRTASDSEVLSGFEGWEHIPAKLNRFLLHAGGAMLDELENSDSSQAFLGYTPLREGGDNSISLHSTLSCNLSKLVQIEGGKGSTSRLKSSMMQRSWWSSCASIAGMSAQMEFPSSHVSWAIEQAPNTLYLADRDYTLPTETVSGVLRERVLQHGGEVAVLPLQATGVDWSSTGSVIVASFGRNDIVGWCESPGALVTWNIFRRGFAEEEEHVPDMMVDHSSCLLCVSCHPLKPAMIAAGSFNGEVVVWDTSRDEPFVAATKIDDLFYREPVTSISWVYSARDDDYRVAAVSAGGKLLFWSLKNNLRWPVEGYRIPAEASREGTQGGVRVPARGGRTAGCTSVSFLREGRHVTSAVVGTEGGAVMKCRLALSRKAALDDCKKLRWSPEADELICRVPSREARQVVREAENYVKDNRGTEVDLAAIFSSRVADTILYPAPGLFRMESHHGPIHAVDCSPFHRALFLSCGADGTGHLYSTLQTRAVLTFEPSNANLMDLKWSRSRPLVFAAAAGDGRIFVYDLLQSPVLPVTSATLPPMGLDRAKFVGEGPGAAFSLSCNPRQRDLLATGDSNGRVLIWRLSWRLANKQPGEELGLERIFKGHCDEASSRTGEDISS